MPRYRFAWSNLSKDFLGRLADALDLKGDPAPALQSAFGARPKEAFVQDAWPFLRDTWLAEDDRARQQVVKELRRLELGDHSAPTGSAAAQLAYLASCRNTVALRQVILSAFLVVGESQPDDIERVIQRAAEAAEETSPVATPTAPKSDGDGGGGTTLDDWVTDTLKKSLGVDELIRDADGDVPIISGSAMVYVRVVDQETSSFVQVFSPLLSGFEPNPAVYESVNNLNGVLRVARAVVHNEGRLIMLEADVPAVSLSAEQLLFTIQLVTGAADHFDTVLQERFGGKTTFPDEAGTDV
jgi:hypothetical protein